MHYELTKPILLHDLHVAYCDAIKHKRSKPYVKAFGRNLYRNLMELCDELWTRTYKPRPSTCFIITDPKPREVFAADFRDRIVHHLYYNYTHEMYERTFIQDSYSCIKGRGTHYGIRRLEGHIRKESQNYSERCYVMKIDIRGYFMNINRQRLLDECLRTLRQMSAHKVGKDDRRTWAETVDMDFVEYLTREIVLLDPTEHCRMIGSRSDWDILPHDKSLFHSPKGCGLPIGNLTSQLFCNVYLNVLDQYMKRQQHCRHYGRYVDDFFIVSADREWLVSLLPSIRRFLSDALGLSMHEGKLVIADVRYGVSYLGAYLKPWRMYVSNTTLRRMNCKLAVLHDAAAAHRCDSRDVRRQVAERLRSSLNSFIGVMIHYRSYRRRLSLLMRRRQFLYYGCFTSYVSLFMVGW